MDVPLIEGSNTLSLITWILGHTGETFADKCHVALVSIDAWIRATPYASPEWQRLLQSKGQIEGFIRHDRVPSFDWHREQRAAA